MLGKMCPLPIPGVPQHRHRSAKTLSEVALARAWGAARGDRGVLRRGVWGAHAVRVEAVFDATAQGKARRGGARARAAADGAGEVPRAHGGLQRGRGGLPFGVTRALVWISTSPLQAGIHFGVYRDSGRDVVGPTSTANTPWGLCAGATFCCPPGPR